MILVVAQNSVCSSATLVIRLLLERAGYRTLLGRPLDASKKEVDLFILVEESHLVAMTVHPFTWKCKLSWPVAEKELQDRVRELYLAISRPDLLSTIELPVMGKLREDN